MTGFQNRSTRGIPIDSVAGFAHAERTDFHTVLPGRVVSFDVDKQVMTVSLPYQAKVGNETFDMPDLLEVPLNIPRSSGGAVTFPIKKGDPVKVSFSGRSLEQWRKEPDKKHLAPQRRMQDMSDATVEMGMQSPSEPLPDYNNENMEIRSLDGKTKFELGSGKLALEGASGEELLTILHETLGWLKQEPALIFTPQYAELQSRLGTIKLR